MASDLFYTPVSVAGWAVLRGMLDSECMSCTLSVEAESKLKAAGLLLNSPPVPERVIHVGCGGLVTTPSCV